MEYTGNLYENLYRIWSMVPQQTAVQLYIILAIIGIITLCTLTAVEYFIRDKYRFLLNCSYISIVFLLIIFSRAPTILLGELNVDESQYISSSITLLNLPYPWISIDGTTVGPITHILLWFINAIGFTQNFFTTRIFALVCFWLPTIFFLWRTGTLLVGSLISKIFITAFTVFMIGIDHIDFIPFHAELPIMLITSYCVYVLTKLHKKLEIKHKWFQLIIVATLIGLIPLIKLQGIFIMIVLTASFTYLIWDREKKDNYLSITIFYFFILFTFALILIWVTGHNGLKDMWDSYIVNNFFYVESSNYGSGYKDYFMRIGIFLDILLQSKAFLSLFIASIGFSLIFSIRKYYLNNIDTTICNIALLLLWAAFISIITPGTNYGHYLILFIVPFMFAIMAFIPRDINANNLKLGVSLTLVITMSIITLEGHIKLIKQIEYIHADENIYNIRNYLNENSRIAVWGYTNSIYLQTSSLLATRIPNSLRAIFESQENNYYKDRFLKDLQQNTPDVIFDTTIGELSLPQISPREEVSLRNFPGIYFYIESNYHIIYQNEDMVVYLRNGL